MSNGSTIVSTTLPTVLGMGVVSETTKTMFDRRGRRVKSSMTTRVKSQSPKVHTGKRGGKYIMKKGRRVYI